MPPRLSPSLPCRSTYPAPNPIRSKPHVVKMTIENHHVCAGVCSNHPHPSQAGGVCFSFHLQSLTVITGQAHGRVPTHGSPMALCGHWHVNLSCRVLLLCEQPLPWNLPHHTNNLISALVHDIGRSFPNPNPGYGGG